jgi:hypothetical protein
MAMPYIVTTKRPCPDCFGGIARDPDPALVADPEVPEHMTWQPCETCATPQNGPTGLAVSRRAVATLEEANTLATETVLKASMTPRQRAAHIIAAPFSVPSHGGTVGPLPDGTVIEVEHVAEATLRQMLPADVRQRVMYGDTVHAFNAREAGQCRS